MSQLLRRPKQYTHPMSFAGSRRLRGSDQREDGIHPPAKCCTPSAFATRDAKAADGEFDSVNDGIERDVGSQLARARRFGQPAGNRLATLRKGPDRMTI